MFQVKVGPFDALQFTADPKAFHNPSAEPANRCYCLDEDVGGCLPSGLLNIEGCQPGSPIYLSWPHFLHGDLELLNGVRGLDPDHEKHSFVFNVEPVSIVYFLSSLC